MSGSGPRRPDDAERRRLAAHRGLATWGDRLVPIGEFQRASAASGRSLPPAERERAISGFLAVRPDATPLEGPFERIAVCGGIYNNAEALEAFLAAAAEAGAEAIYCLGDLGGFGPRPERIRPLLEAGGVRSIQGNYEQSLAGGRGDCNCGYADPRDNHYALLSYRYTAERCDPELRAWLGELPARRRVRLGERELLLVHGSPRRVNEFLFESTTSDAFLEVLLEEQRADAVLCTHTGLPWHRRLESGRDAVNVGVLGRPPNDGSTTVRWALLEAREDQLAVEICELAYDHQSLARLMRAERLPEPFVETIESGWWTTCLEILPAKERAAGRF